MKDLSPFRKITSFSGDVLIFITGIATVVMAFLLAGNTIARYLFDSPVAFAEEYTAYLVIMITFLPLAYTQRKNGHIEVDIIINKLPDKTRLILGILTDNLTLVVSILMIWYGIILTIKSFQHNVLSQTIMMTPLWIPQMVIVVGLIAFVLEEVFSLKSKVGELRNNSTREPKL